MLSLVPYNLLSLLLSPTTVPFGCCPLQWNSPRNCLCSLFSMRTPYQLLLSRSLWLIHANHNDQVLVLSHLTFQQQLTIEFLPPSWLQWCLILDYSLTSLVTFLSLFAWLLIFSPVSYCPRFTSLATLTPMFISSSPMALNVISML